MSEVFIYCDDASHPRRSYVDKFRREPDGRWLQVVRETNRLDAHTSHTVTLHVVDNDANDEVVADLSMGAASLAKMAARLTGTPSTRNDVRTQSRLYCRKCKNRPGHSLVVRSEKLSPLLDALTSSGVSEVPIRVVVAMLHEQRRKD